MTTNRSVFRSPPGRAAVCVAAPLAILSGLAAPAAAHPHVFIEASTSIVFDEDGQVDRVRQAWRFDPFYSTFAIQGYDGDANGLLSREELAPLAEENVVSMKEFGYFSFLYADEAEHAFDAVNEAWLDYDPDIRQLTLYFELALAEPVDPAEARLVLDVFDPAYFVAFEMNEALPFSLVNAPQGCALELEAPPEIDPMVATMLSAIPANETIPEAYRSLTETLSNTAIVTCGADGDG